MVAQKSMYGFICAMTFGQVSSCVRYWQKINFLTEKGYFFFMLWKWVMRVGMLFKQVFEVKITLQASPHLFLVKY